MRVKKLSAAVVAFATLAALVILLTDESYVGHQQQFNSILEEVDPDEPFNQEGYISGINPQSGPFRGGNKMTVFGTSLLLGGASDVRQVLVGGVPVKRIISASPTELVVILGHRSSRLHSAGPAAVVVVSHSKGQVVAHSLYTFHAPPRIVEVRPDNGPHEGGNEVVIRGKHLTAGKHDKVRVKIDGVPCKLLEVSKHMLRVRVAKRRHLARMHKAHVTVTSKQYGFSKLRHSYMYNPAPAITHVSPVEGPAHGHNMLRIHGDMLTSGGGRTEEDVSVIVGETKAEVLSFSPNSVTIKAPKHQPGLVAIQVRSSLHGTSVKSRAYKYNAEPLITSVSPQYGQAAGGDHIVLHGHNLGKGDVQTVFFGHHRARVLRSAHDGSEVLVQTREFSDDEEGHGVPIRLKSTTFGSTHAKSRFHVGRRGRIHRISPAEGPCGGGTRVTVTGENLAVAHEEPGALTAEVAGSPAQVLNHTAGEVMLLTGPCSSGVTRGVVSLFSPHTGHTVTPFSVKFQYNPLSIVHHISPEVGEHGGGAEMVVRGDRLCGVGCDDLESVRIGNALIQDFKVKTPRRLVFSAPSAAQAGGTGEHTIVVHSDRFGRTVIPRGFVINNLAARGAVTPSNVPLVGGTTVVVDAPELTVAGEVASFEVTLAGVPAKVLSVSPTSLVVAAGDATALPGFQPEMRQLGKKGTVKVTALIHGSKYVKDLGLLFRYNPTCSVDTVAVRPGNHGGELAVLIVGSNMGYSDEHISVDGAPAKIHRRERREANVFRHHATVLHATSEVSMVEVVSKRSGKCVWKRVPQELQGSRKQEEPFDAAKASVMGNSAKTLSISNSDEHDTKRLEDEDEASKDILSKNDEDELDKLEEEEQ